MGEQVPHQEDAAQACPGLSEWAWFPQLGHWGLSASFPGQIGLRSSPAVWLCKRAFCTLSWLKIDKGFASEILLFKFLTSLYA